MTLQREDQVGVVTEWARDARGFYRLIPSAGGWPPALVWWRLLPMLLYLWRGHGLAARAEIKHDEHYQEWRRIVVYKAPRGGYMVSAGGRRGDPGGLPRFTVFASALDAVRHACLWYKLEPREFRVTR